MLLSIVLSDYFFFFFFKQKTAYEMRISDWSSDVCSSDLRALIREAFRSVVPTDIVRRTSKGGTTGFVHRQLARNLPLCRELLLDGILEIGRASCRERVCQYV